MRLGLGHIFVSPAEAGEYGTDLVLEIATTGSNEEITIPTLFSPVITHDAVIDWGDGSADSIITAWNDPDLTHEYASAGDHIVRIDGDFPIINYYGHSQADRDKLKRVLNWGETQFQTMRRAFYRCQGLTSVVSDTSDMSAVEDMLECFYVCDSMTECDVSGWDVSSVTTMVNMFAFNDAHVTLDLSTWVCTAVLDMGGMFQYSDGFETIITSSNFIGSSCTDIAYMFAENTALETVSGTVNWDVSAVTTMANMFDKCTSLTALDVSGWDTSAVTTVTFMFWNADLLTDLAIDNWDITALLVGDYFMYQHVGLNTARYDATLIAWEAQAVNDDVDPHFGGSKYTGGGAAATARANLVADHSWSITDGGVA